MQVAACRYRIKGTNLYVRPTAQAAAQPLSQPLQTPYEGASLSPRVVRWTPNVGGPNTTIGGSLPLLRSRARDKVRRDALANSAIEAWVTNVVGIGIKPQFVTADAGLNRALADLWLAWTDESDAAGQFDFYGQQALAARSLAEAGEVFARLRTRRPEDGLSVPLQVQLLESEFCPTEKNEPQAGSGPYTQNGVVFNAIGARTGYWMARVHPDDATAKQLRAAHAQLWSLVPASDICHLAHVLRPDQIRGTPLLTRALIKLHDLDKYDDAQLVRQQIAALFAGFVRQTQETGPVFADQDAADNTGLALASLEPGTMQVLEPGQEIAWSAPPSPGDSYEAFVRHQERRIAVAAGILYEQLTGDYSQINDRQFRAAVNEFRRRCRMWQHHLIVFAFCRPVLRRWLELALLAGAVTLPESVTLAQAAQAKWVPERFDYINPEQDVNTMIKEMRSGIESRSGIASQRGVDVHRLDAEIASDNARADDLGLVFDSDARLTNAQGLYQKDNPENVAEGDGGAGSQSTSEAA